MNRDRVRERLLQTVQGRPQQADGPEPWTAGRRTWRLSRRIGRRQIDLALRLRSARDLPGMGRARLAAMGLSREIVSETLCQIRSVDGWPIAWTATAQRFLGEARGVDEAEQTVEVARARQRAALAYHAASWLAYDDERALRTLRAARTSLFARSVSHLLPLTQPVQVAWRASRLPAYLRLPARAAQTGRPAPLVVLLNGATTAKEELILWSDAFVERGLAVLALDQPGTGEAAVVATASGEHDDILDGVRTLVAAEPLLDATKIVVVGFSFGGTLAVRAAAYDRRLVACVAVTPPYEPSACLAAANPMVLEQIVGHICQPEAMPELAESFSLVDTLPRLRVPLLVLGAGRDLIVPPAESRRLAAAVGALGTLLWYPRAGHGLYELMPTWTADVADWIEAVLTEPVATPVESTVVDSQSQVPAEPRILVDPEVVVTPPPPLVTPFSEDDASAQALPD